MVEIDLKSNLFWHLTIFFNKKATRAVKFEKMLSVHKVEFTHAICAYIFHISNVRFSELFHFHDHQTSMVSASFSTMAWLTRSLNAQKYYFYPTVHKRISTFRVMQECLFWRICLFQDLLCYFLKVFIITQILKGACVESEEKEFVYNFININILRKSCNLELIFIGLY